MLDGGIGYDTIRFMLTITGIEITILDASPYGGMSGIDNLGIFSQPFMNINNLIGTFYMDTLIGIIDEENVFRLTAPDQGYLKTKNRTLNFISFENFTGGDEDDRFIIDDNASISGDLDGGDGSDMISYETRHTAVEVNLSTGLIPDVSGVLINIENVSGGMGDDIITGDDNDNILVGGSGNDTMFGLGGDDDFWIGTGSNDKVDGGDGFDTTYYHWENTSPISNLICERIIYLQPPFVWERYWFKENSYLDYKVVKDANTAPIENILMLDILHTFENGFKFQKQVLIKQWHKLGYEMTVFAGHMMINFVVPDFLNGYQMAVYFWDKMEQEWIEIESFRYLNEDGSSYVRAMVAKPGYYTVTVKGTVIEEPIITESLYK